jgi:two-component system, NtrC family, nitrogen regulation sensor histidine kinase GlnL
MTAARAERTTNGGGVAEAVLDALPHPVVTVAPDGRVVDANMAEPPCSGGIG